jgi:hypothetical protein
MTNIEKMHFNMIKMLIQNEIESYMNSKLNDKNTYSSRLAHFYSSYRANMPYSINGN